MYRSASAQYRGCKSSLSGSSHAVGCYVCTYKSKGHVATWDTSGGALDTGTLTCGIVINTQFLS